jgi:hypothetical protein
VKERALREVFYGTSPVITVYGCCHRRRQFGAELVMGNFGGNLTRVHYCTCTSRDFDICFTFTRGPHIVLVSSKYFLVHKMQTLGVNRLANGKSAVCTTIAFASS